jgi:hypothetical protein
MVVSCSRLLKGGTPQEERLESVQTFECSNAQQNFLAMVVRSKVIQGTFNAKGTLATTITRRVLEPQSS